MCGETLTYSYDVLGWKVETRAAGGTLLAEWVYDTLAKGQLTSSTSRVHLPTRPGRPPPTIAQPSHLGASFF